MAQTGISKGIAVTVLHNIYSKGILKVLPYIPYSKGIYRILKVLHNTL